MSDVIDTQGNDAANRLHIRPRDGRTRFAPGERIAGMIAWSLTAPADTLELQLRWETRGKGVSDSETIASLRIDSPPAQGGREFQLVAPDAPYSAAGKLVSVGWSLTLRAGDAQTALDIVIAPHSRAVDLYGIRPG